MRFGDGQEVVVADLHVHGAHNKLEGARWIVRELLGRDLDAERACWVYVGDSTNDQLMFEAFDQAIGVANIRRFLPELTHLPRYVTPSERGAGFAEMVQLLLQARASDITRA